ncbi:MAG: hypothetical protein ACKOC8_10330 [Pirellulales bacterium]
MSLAANQRRDQRRRLVVSWKRADSSAASTPTDAARHMAAYDPEAHPERQRGPAMLLPTTVGGLALAAAAILVPTAAAIAVGVSDQVFARPIFVGGGRFARTLAALGHVVDPRAATSLQAWLAQVFLALAAATALIVRLMRRHRRDDYKGRFRAWGWMAAILLVTACAGVVPVGRVVAAALSDATGIAVGPAGIGWWLGLAATAWVAVSLWAVLPLHERLGTSTWLGLALLAWAVSAGAAWLGGADPRMESLMRSSWSAGAAAALVAMLAAARSVIREVRGQCGRPAASGKGRPEPARPTGRSEPVGSEESDDEPLHAADDTEFVDGSEQDERHLSKAERKRLRRLARMNGQAA